MNKNELKRYIDNCNDSLEGFVLSPLKKLEDCILYLDSFQNYLVKLEYPYLLEKLKNVSNILFLAKHYLEHTKYLDPDLMEELLFFLKGAFLDLSDHLGEIVDKDLESLKNKHWQKILFLNDWVKDFLKLPEIITPVVKEKFEKYLVFSLGNDHFTIPIKSFVEMILLENEKSLKQGIIDYNQQKVALVDRQKLFGDYVNKFPKTVVIFKENNSFMALEVDQIVNFLDLNIKQFFPIELVTGESYQGPIDYIAILENKPIFVLNPQSSTLRPLTT